MRILISLSILLVSGMLLFAQPVSFTQTIRGTVLDDQSGSSLPGATLQLDGLNLSVVSDSKGNFQFRQVPAGRQTVSVSMSGYEPVSVSNIEVTSSKEVVLEIRMKERVKVLADVVVRSGKSKSRALNEFAVVSARQLSTDEAFRYSGTRNDPSRMAQNFAGVSGSNDARNDIVIRGNSPAGVLWRMEGIDIPNPNHYSTLGATGGPVSMLNINTLKNSDFLTSAFPATYGNAMAGVFDLRLRNGNAQKTEFTGQMGFNGFEFAAEGPFSKNSNASYLIDYRYSMVAALQNLGLNFGTGSATPYYQDLTFKINLPTQKSGTFSLFGLGGESHIHFKPDGTQDDNLYSVNDGRQRESQFKNKSGVIGLSHQYFFNANTSAKTTLSVSGLWSKYQEFILEPAKPAQPSMYRLSKQTRYSLNHTFNKKFSAADQLTAGVIADVNRLGLEQDYRKDADTVLTRLLNTHETATLLRGFVNYQHRYNNKLSTNLGLYGQYFTLNKTSSLEPRFNIRYQFQPNQAVSFGAGMHSQTQPLDVYFYQSPGSNNVAEYTNKQLGFVRSAHGVLGYDLNAGKHFRIKTELYGQYIYNAAVEQTTSSFSMLNSGSGFAFPDKTHLVNRGKGYNYGAELTVERFLHQGLYYLLTVSVFESKYRGSDAVWRNTAFNSNYVINTLAGKEWKLNAKTSFGIDTKFTITGGQRYTPFDREATLFSGYVIYQEDKAFSLQNATYLRWDLKFSVVRNARKITQKWYIDLQNLTNRKNIYMRTMNTLTGVESQINQMGFFPNVNYQITF